MNITVFEPYSSDSHKCLLRGLRQHSAHRISSYELPGSFWKWRMHGSAVTFARMFLSQHTAADLLLATDMLDLATFLGLTRRRTDRIPSVVYFHENQLTHPLPPGSKRDLHYAYINYTSALVADRVFFNSEFHRRDFFFELPRLLKHFPDYNELDTIHLIADKSEVLPLGLELASFDQYRPETVPDGPLRIVWNHRWEYDKRPSVLFGDLDRLAQESIQFEIIILGQNYQRQPNEFLKARERLRTQIRHFGYTKDFAECAILLWLSDIQVRCAIQDYFGASTCEAIFYNCTPILPNRPNYPAFIPDEAQALCLYEDYEGLVERLRWAASNVDFIPITFSGTMWRAMTDDI